MSQAFSCVSGGSLGRRSQNCFRQTRSWSQPSAVADSVIYKFQQQLDSQEYRQAVDLIDSFVGGWTKAGNEAVLVTRRLRACVSTGTTGLTQLTDIALAQPAKAALSRNHADLRDMLREKARQEGVAPTYKTGLAEMLGARSEWVQAGKPVAFTEEEQQGNQYKYEPTYLWPGEVSTGFFPVEFEMTESEQLAIEELLQHPTVRQGQP